MGTAAGRGLAHFFGGAPRTLAIDCGGLAARMRVERSDDGQSVRLTGEAHWGGDDGQRWAKAIIEVDAASFDQACAVADHHGGLPRLAAMIGSRSGYLLGVGLEDRPILGRLY